MQRIRQPIRSTLEADRAKLLLEAVRRRIQRGESSHDEVKARVFAAFTKYFTELAQPTTEDSPLLAMGSRDPQDYVDFIEGVAGDLANAMTDARNLSESVVAAFNASTTDVRALEAFVKRVTSKSQDLQHLSETFAEDTIVAGDDFADDSRIDREANLEVPQVEIPVNQNTVALRRQQSVNVLEGTRPQIRILSTFRIYEGFLYALEGEARPEGGRFHFSGEDNSIQSDASAPGVPSDLLSRYNTWRTGLRASGVQVQTPDGMKAVDDITADMAFAWSRDSGNSWGPFTSGEWDMLANNYHFDPTFSSEPGYIDPTSRQVVTDKGAPLSERQPGRLRMVDGSPDSFWECEYLVNTVLAAPQAAADGQTDPSAPPAPQLTMGQLIDLIASPAVDKMDLDCSIIIELPDVQVINWINLLPHNFSDASWLEVVDVSTSLDGSNYESLEGFHEDKYENILTADVNKELSAAEANTTLAPNRFQYTGQGVWTFPARQVRFVKIDLLQKTPIPAPYDVLMVDMTQTLLATHTGHRGTESTTYQFDKTEELGYIQSLKVMSGNGDNSGLETGPSASTNPTREPGSTTLDVVQDVLDPGEFLHSDSQGASTTHDYSGWSVKATHTQTKWDKARYAIGVKEIGIWAYLYAQRSGFISVPFKTPKPIRSVSLHTDEIVPKAFQSGIVKPWIRYWISLDDGQNWQPIAPAGEGPASRVDGIRIPQVIHVNTGLPVAERDPRAGYMEFNGEVNTIRLKAILERPEDLEDMTPVLKGYRIRAVVRGGL